jgi:hypothetical protein
MKTFTIPAAAVLVALWAVPSSAEVLDISTLKCADIVDSSPEEIGMILAWIDGYLGGRADDTRLDIDRFSANADEAASACEKDPNAGLLTVIKAAEAQ